MKISACYIVKNEEAVIRRSIESLIDAVDEIILVDTGSTDRTIEFVRKYPKVNIYSYTWNDDFAAARNAAIEKVDGDWIVFLDADEFFAPETVKNIRVVIEKAQSAEVLLVRMKNIEPATGELLSEFWAPRIFQRADSLRYQGKIHERFCRSDGSSPEVKLIPAESLFLLHTGYSAVQSREKAQRNLTMLRESMRNMKHPEEFYMYMAEAYYGLGDMVQAERYARMDIAGGRRSITYASRSYRLLLQLLAEKKAYVERKEIAAKAVEIFPELPEFHAELAECLAYDLDYVPAIAAMEKALSMISAVDSLEISQFDEDCRQIGAQRLGIWRQILDRMKTIKISACLIAKNEAKDLPRWLKNVSAYSDEIVFADTGSKDATVEIAEKAGVRVYHYPWQDDFAAAKNFVLERAKGDWITFLDADEYFAVPEKVRGFLAWMDCCQSNIDAVMVMLANIDEDDHDYEIQRFNAIRLFKNFPELRYKGNIHESIHRCDGELQLWIEDRLLIYHTGYSSRRIQAKLKRNLALLKTDIEKNGEQPGHYRYLADCYFGLKDYDKTLYYALLAIDAPVIAVGSQGDLYHLAVESMRQLEYPAEKMLSFLRRAIEKFPDLPDYYAERGMVHSSLGQFKDAEENLKKAIGIFEGKERQDNMESSYFQGAADLAYRRLAEIYYQEGQQQKAEKYFLQALELNPYRNGSLQIYRSWHSEENAEIFAERIWYAYPHGKEDLEYLFQWSAREDEIGLLLYFDTCLQDEYAAGSTLRPFFIARQDNKIEKLYSLSVEGIADRMCRLFSMLIYWQETIRKDELFLLERALRVLPERLQQIFQAYMGNMKCFEAVDLDGYLTLLPTIVQSNTVDHLDRYINIARQCAPDVLRRIADRLYELRAWENAIRIYAQLQDKIALDKIDEEFWCNYGICCYMQRDYIKANSCFKRADVLGCVRKDIVAYRKWSEEGLKNG